MNILTSFLHSSDDLTFSQFYFVLQLLNLVSLFNNSEQHTTSTNLASSLLISFLNHCTVSDELFQSLKSNSNLISFSTFNFFLLSVLSDSQFNLIKDDLSTSLSSQLIKDEKKHSLDFVLCVFPSVITGYSISPTFLEHDSVDLFFCLWNDVTDITDDVIYVISFYFCSAVQLSRYSLPQVIAKCLDYLRASSSQSGLFNVILCSINCEFRPQVSDDVSVFKIQVPIKKELISIGNIGNIHSI
ncbi:hypothetical protein GEMRC1_004028 [Eukaryota sp. GEM-RC1]